MFSLTDFSSRDRVIKAVTGLQIDSSFRRGIWMIVINYNHRN